MGDVSGHGVDSGLIMMMAQTSIVSLVNNSADCKPSTVLESVNSVLRENISRLGSDHYMTMMALHFKDGEITFAGKHQDLIIYRSALNKTEVIPSTGTWLGIADNIGKYLTDRSVKIQENDVILLFTDGITEATTGAERCMVRTSRTGTESIRRSSGGKTAGENHHRCAGISGRAGGRYDARGHQENVRPELRGSGG